MSTTEVAAQLFHMQQLDLEYDRLRAEQQNLASSLKETRTLQKLRTECSTLKQQLQASQSARSEAEWALNDLSRRLKIQEQRLQEKKGDAQEQQNLQNEIKRLKTQRGRQDDLVLQTIDAEEFLREIVERKESEFVLEEGNWQVENAPLISRLQQIDLRLAELQSQRTAFADLLSEEHLKQYESMRKSKQGRAVSKVEKDSCEWCLALLTRSELQKVLVSPVLQTCTNCGRILYYQPAPTHSG